MRYTTFGRHTGLRVSEVALGTGTFGTRWGHGAKPEEARRLFDRFVEAGGNFFDCADGYQFGEAEELLGSFIQGHRDTFVISSKFTAGAGPNASVSLTGNSRKAMMSSVEASLKRLKTDHLDLYWVHFADGLTPLEEIARGFDDLVRAGKIHYGGLSDFPAWRVSRAATLAELRGWAPIAGLQIEYSLVERTADRELLPMAEGLGLGVTLWSPLGGGFLTGKFRQGERGRTEYMPHLVHTETTPQKTQILDTVIAISGELGVTPGQVSLAWLRQRAARATTSVIPILGASTLAQLDANLAASAVTLSEEQMARLDAVSAISLGFPHEMLASEGLGLRIAGGRPELRRPPFAPVA
ncbi:aldo/keto reductase [Stigmatella sp. ncwal1]|uniref:Aldo/keto reductase n=1 Tax=Stigmatella ashevillensis TaxID=2995309 RepID=A0ABT5DGR4_9BACT|nr:aldo/keto reductase [Stigmatella ashevillena]MDC0712859.1 aldo/keto reductase [Stigmatella ashevillena]